VDGSWLVHGLFGRFTIADYSRNAGVISFDFGAFVNETLLPAGEERIKTAVLYDRYRVLAKDKGWRIMSAQSFVAELRERVLVKRDCFLGNVVVGYTLKEQGHNCGDSLQEVS